MKSWLLAVLLIVCSSVIAGPGYWTPTGPDGGRVERVVADYSSSYLFYLATSTSVYRSADGGASWQPRSAGLSARPQVWTLTAEAGVVNHLLIGDGNRLMHTENGGLSWEEQGPALAAGQNVSAIHVPYGKPSRWWLGTWDSVTLWFSSNAGSTWSQRGSGWLGNEISVIQTDPENFNHVWVATSGTTSHLYDSTDGGLNWTEITSDLPVTVSIIFDAFMGTGGKRYVLVLDNSNQTVLLHSEDGGVSWSQSMPPLFAKKLLVDPLNPDRVMALGTGPAYSLDGGATWTRLLSKFSVNGKVAQALSGIFNPIDANEILLSTANHGMMRMASGATTFTPFGSGLRARNIRALAIDPSNSSRLLAGTAEYSFNADPLFESTDAAANWSGTGASSLPPAALRKIKFDPLGPSVVYAAGLNRGGTLLTSGMYQEGDGGVYKSIDGGVSWYVIDAGLPVTSGQSLLLTVRDLELIPGSDGGNGHLQDILITGSGFFSETGGVISKGAGRIYRSTDSGASWTESDTGISAAFLDGSNLIYPRGIQLEVDPSNPMLVYAATFVAYQPSTTPAGFGNGVWKSVDGGLNWSQSSTGLPRLAAGLATPTDVLSLKLDPSSPNVLYASANDLATGVSHLYKSADGAAHWAPVGAGLPEQDIREIQIDSDGHVYVAMGSYDGNPGGVFLSQDGGATWHSVSIGLERSGYVFKLAIDESGANKRLYAGTNQSVYVLDLVPDSDWDGVPDSVEAAGFASLDANNDGVADSQQSQVATLVADSLNRGASTSVTISVQPLIGSCNQLENVTALDLAEVPDLKETDLSLGGFHFEIPDCQQARVNIHYHTASSFRPGWFLFAYAPIVNGGELYDWQKMVNTTATGTEVTFDLVDGQPGEIGTANGRLIFQGAVGYQEKVFTSDFGP